VHVRLLPQFDLEAGEVTFANAPGTATPELVRAKRMTLQIRLLPLFLGAFEGVRLALAQPVIALEVEPDGRPGWQFPLPLPRALSIDAIAIDDGTILYRNWQTGGGEKFDAVTLSLSMPGIDTPLAADGSARWHGEAVKLHLDVGSPRRLLLGGGSPVWLTAMAPAGSFGISGEIDRLPPSRFDGAFAGSLASLTGTANWLGWPFAGGGRDFGGLSAKGKIAWEDGKISLAGTEFSSTSIAGMVDGSLDVAGARPFLHGRIDADQLDLGALLAGAGIGWLGGAGSLSLSLDGPINDPAGSGELDLARGQLRGADLVALAGRAGTSGGVMEFSALSDRFTLGAGSVRTDALRLMAGAVPIDGAGTIDLGQRTLNYRLTVHRSDAPPTQVEISGPWDAPSFARR
jgi:uncharacterized protein involved in outer membrane biogenesis